MMTPSTPTAFALETADAKLAWARSKVSEEASGASVMRSNRSRGGTRPSRAPAVGRAGMMGSRRECGPVWWQRTRPSRQSRGKSGRASWVRLSQR